ncbi:MRC1 [Branchiostoma lanceolatum]|uniref:MRC1 protein n=1 Tax=Branchiostoma lanceolatum TaxID=7740 RepID=A0A8K0ENF9_BRALA|nr:MRC1 [Branchiostoma lanceolatum]
MSVASIIVLFLVLETSFSTAAGCPGGFTKFRGACFKVYHQVASYDQAREFCANQGGLLAMPKDNSTDAFLMKLKNTVDPRGYFWFGLSDENWEGRWMWEDGTVLNKSAGWSNWREGQPDNHKGDEDCAHYNSVAMSGWNDLPCSDKVAKFICQTTDDVQTDSPKTTMTSLVTEQMGTSATQGSSGNLRKITFPAPRRVSNYAGLGTPLSQDLTSFTLCLHMRTDMSSYSHTSLVSYSVGSVQHANELLLFNDGGSGGRFELYVQNTKADLGALPVWDSGWHVICVTWRSSNGDWKLYADGAFRASGTGVNVGGKVRGGGTWILAQDQDTVGGSFVESQAFSGELSQVNLWDRVLTPEEIGTDWSVFCNHHGNVIDWATINIQVVGQATSDQYRCQVTSTPASVERPRTTMTSLVTDQMGTPAPQGSPDCPKDYQSFQGICYKAYNTAANFQQSIRVCGADGGTLAMPRDQKTNDFLITLKNSVDRKSPFRFGLHDRIKENVWRWMDGQELGDFTDWGPGEPNDAFSGQGEDCAEYYPLKKNKWNDKACHYDRKFICQVDKTEAVRVSSSSDGVRYDAKAVLESPVFSTNCSNNTLVFHYHMQGSIVPATLHVSIVGNMSNSDSELLGTFPFKVTYGQTNRVHMDFHREQPFRVVFTAELDHSVNSTDGAGQIHLYDVIVLNDKCRPTDESAAAGFFQEPTLSKGAIIGIIVVFVIVAVAIAAGIKFARGMKRQHLRLMSTSTTVLMRRDNVMFEPDAE